MEFRAGPVTWRGLCCLPAGKTTRSQYIGYLDSMPARSPLVIQTQFSEALLGKYMPRNMHKNFLDDFSTLRQGSIVVAKYEARFYKLARHANMIFPIGYKWI